MLHVQTGLVELSRQAGVAESELPPVPCHPMLLVAHAERDLLARSIDDQSASTISALVMLSAIECVARRLCAADSTACSASVSDRRSAMGSRRQRW